MWHTVRSVPWNMFRKICSTKCVLRSVPRNVFRKITRYYLCSNFVAATIHWNYVEICYFASLVEVSEVIYFILKLCKVCLVHSRSRPNLLVVKIQIQDKRYWISLNVGGRVTEAPDSRLLGDNLSLTTKLLWPRLVQNSRFFRASGVLKPNVTIFSSGFTALQLSRVVLVTPRYFFFLK